MRHWQPEDITRQTLKSSNNPNQWGVGLDAEPTGVELSRLGQHSCHDACEPDSEIKVTLRLTAFGPGLDIKSSAF